MPVLRDQVDRWTETFSGIALSAEDRFRDAQELCATGRHRGAVYVLGLAAEMWLKLASYRLCNAIASDPVGPYASNVRSFMDAHAPGTDRESGHSLRYWAEFIILWRGSLVTRQQVGLLRLEN